jgi:hypothetical protein
VAPANGRFESLAETPEDQCQEWLLQLLRDYPDRQPCPLPQLCDQAISKFAGLKRRGFWRALVLAQDRSRNRKWSDPGRLEESRQK